MKSRTNRYFVGDFETTVYDGQDHTEVWASALVEFNTEDVSIFHSIRDTMLHLCDLAKEDNLVVYYHNLKFDGSFFLDYLLHSKLKQAYIIPVVKEHYNQVEWLDVKDMPNNSYKYIISDKGSWYGIIIKVHNHIIDIRDSLKLLPFSVKQIGKSFGTKHTKLDMEYTGYRYAGCTITDEEKKYIANDVLVVKEALEIMFSQGHTKLTIGSCCLSEFKSITNALNKTEYDTLFPQVYNIPLDEATFASKTVGDYVLKSYHGGWCYVVDGKENKRYTKGLTADVNSLYPSMMSSESGNRYPVGEPIGIWSGDRLPDVCMNDDIYFFVRVRTRFKIKENHLPFIQIKHNPLYRPTECLKSTDVYNPATGNYVSEYYTPEGEYHDTRVTLTLTKTDYILFLDQYDVYDFEILDGVAFNTEIGIFDEYINKYKKIKLESKGALRTLAKLFLNNLYGKMASTTNSSFKLAYLDGDKVKFDYIQEHKKQAGYIPVGSAITSYARNFTIRAAQANYHGVNERGFIYADTDSIHCDLEPEELVGVPVHDKNFCHWKLESCWDYGIFTRQKTYIEHVTHEDLQPIPNPYYNIKCAGMPERCKNLLVLNLMGYKPTEKDNLSEHEKEFLSQPRTIEDFKVGLSVPGNLRPKRIAGGIVLVDQDYIMRDTKGV